MKLVRLVCAVLALSIVAGWAGSSFACDDSKSAKVKASAAASSGATCTAAMAAKCTPEMAAACKASMAAGGPDLCVGKKASAAAAVAASEGATCTAAMAAKCTPEMMAACKAAKAAAVTASVNGACPYATSAVAASAGDHCAAGKASAAAASAHGACATKGAKFSASAAGACTGHGMAAMAANSNHADCDACADMADCSGALDAAGAHRQTVRLKNGIMYVYTADSPRSVSAVQAAVARRMDRMARLASAGDKARLCDECKAMRGAMASGKLSREVINIEGGSLTLVTSSDPTVVAKLHAMADDKLASATRVKL